MQIDIPLVDKLDTVSTCRERQNHSARWDWCGAAVGFQGILTMQSYLDPLTFGPASKKALFL